MRVGWDLSNSNSVEWLNIIPNLECVTYIHFIFISSSDSPIFLNILISKAVYDVCVCVCKIMLYALSLPWASWEKADSSRTNMIESRRKITPLTCPLHAILGELIAQPEECACLHACHPALSLRVAVKWFLWLNITISFCFENSNSLAIPRPWWYQMMTYQELLWAPFSYLWCEKPRTPPQHSSALQEARC